FPVPNRSAPKVLLEHAGGTRFPHRRTIHTPQILMARLRRSRRSRTRQRLASIAGTYGVSREPSSDSVQDTPTRTRRGPPFKTFDQLANPAVAATPRPRSAVAAEHARSTARVAVRTTRR